MWLPRLLVLAFALVLPSAVQAEPLLRGPHPFLRDNALEVRGGFAHAGFFGGPRLAVSYGYAAAGSLWLDLSAGLVDGGGPLAVRDKCACADHLNTYADVLAGISYRLRTSLPLVPYGKVAGGLLTFFPERSPRGAGLGARGAAGARWYLYDWLGFGLEVGTVLGFTGLERWTASGVDTGLRGGMWLWEAGVTVDVQF